MSGKNVALMLVTLALAAPALPSLACAVCFGDSDSPMAKAADMSMLFMIIVTYFVIVGGFATVVALRIRARRRALEAQAAS